MTKDEILEALKALRGVVAMGKVIKLEEGQYIDMEMMKKLTKPAKKSPN